MHNVLITVLSYIPCVLPVVFSRRLNSVTSTSSYLEAADDTGTLGMVVKSTHTFGCALSSLIYGL